MVAALKLHDPTKFAPDAKRLITQFEIDLSGIDRPECSEAAGAIAAENVYSLWGGKRTGAKRRAQQEQWSNEFKKARSEVLALAYGSQAPQDQRSNLKRPREDAVTHSSC